METSMSISYELDVENFPYKSGYSKSERLSYEYKILTS